MNHYTLLYKNTPRKTVSVFLLFHMTLTKAVMKTRQFYSRRNKCMYQK